MQTGFWILNWTQSQSCSIKRKKQMNAETLEIIHTPRFSVTYKQLQKEGLYKVLSDIKKFYKKHTEYVAPTENDFIKLMQDIREWEYKIEHDYRPFHYYKRILISKIKNILKK